MRAAFERSQEVLATLSLQAPDEPRQVNGSGPDRLAAGSRALRPCVRCRSPTKRYEGCDVCRLQTPHSPRR